MTIKGFREVTEARGDTAVFTLGRFNPPTTGHEKLIKKMDSVAKKNSAPMYVFPTHSTDPAKNPLPHGLKVAYMKKMYRKYAKNIQVSKARNVFEVAKVLYDKGHKAIIMVVGSDRVSEFSNLLDKYNGVKSTHGYYGFDNIEVVSAGERDPDAEGVTGMSASKMRAAAADGDKDSFLKGIPSGFKDGDKLYRDVRANMGIREERDMGDMDDMESRRDAYLTGKLWNVGEKVIVNGVEGEVVRKGTNYLSYMTEDGKVHKAWLHQIDERDYKKEYANYQGKPEQIARRSSRNQARRIMGDKTKVGMDVGHKDNNPLNNDPKNLKNEDPTKNRREPRLREEDEVDEKYDSDKFFGGKGTPEQRLQLMKLQNKALRAIAHSPKQKAIKKDINALRKKMGMKVSEELEEGKKLPPHLAKFFDKKGKLKKDAEKRIQKGRNKSKIKDVTPKGYGPKEEVDEMTSPLPWLNKAVAKIHQMTHPKGYEKLVKQYMDGMKNKKNRDHPGKWASELAREYRGVEGRDFIRYINKLVDKGKIPQELKAEYQSEEKVFTFKQFVETINSKDTKDG